MSKRKAPGAARMDMPMMPEMDADEKKVSDMHDALYSLSDKIRKPMERPGDKLLPDHLKKSPAKHGEMARKQIRALHRAFREEK